MRTVHTIVELRAQVAAWKQAGERVAFVPTMGNLHRGHIRLVELASKLAPRTVASIFVNPMQFGPSEDFGAYPRTLAEDSRQLEASGLDLLFVPSVTEVYSRRLDKMTQVTVPELQAVLCGAIRAGHFNGVTTVVSKLFNMVQPDVAMFGEKDWQQLVIIRRMAADLDMPVEIVGVPTVRESDGLALSSRNGYLSTEDRVVAPKLYAALRATAERLRARERDFAVLEAEARKRLELAGFRPDYFEIRRSHDLQRPIEEDAVADLRIFAAAWLGRARLIDNLPVGPD
jgi:pantoate--beta-alanine ligase